MEDTKFCPIMKRECIEEQCAFWWSLFRQGTKPIDPMCAIKGIADGLGEIAYNWKELGMDIYIKDLPKEK